MFNKNFNRIFLIIITLLVALGMILPTFARIW